MRGIICADPAQACSRATNRRVRPVKALSRVLVGLTLAATALLTACQSPSGDDDRALEGAVGGSPTQSGDAPPEDPAPVSHAEPQNLIDRSDEDELMRGWMEAKALCHTDHGFPATLMPDGGIETQVAPGQDDDYIAVSRLCDEIVAEQRGPAPVDVFFTEDELSVRYDLLLEQAECLSEAGYPVVEATSRERYIEQTLAFYEGADDVVPWDPSLDVPPSSGPDAQEQCPAPTGQDVAERQQEGTG